MIKAIKEFWSYVCNECKEDKRFVFYFLISPTLILASYSKFKVKENKDKVRDLIKCRNSLYLLITVLLASILWILENSVDKNNLKWLAITGSYYAFSRVNEIFFAFVNDAHSHLRYTQHSSSLKYYERIPLAMKSYLELIILYGVIVLGLQALFCQVVNCSGEPCLLNMWQAIYYSGVTITTLGYGDFTPKNFATQIMAIYEVINGLSLLVVSFTVYVSRSISDQEHKRF